jgi:predicted outer membrane repeat protein
MSVTTLTIRESNFTGNQAGNDGGGLRTRWGTLIVTATQLISNTAGNDGGAVEAGSSVAVMDECTVSGNQAGNDGGGLATDYGALVMRSTFKNNSAGNYGGGIRNEGVLLLANSTFVGNAAGAGGGVYSGYALQATNCTLSANRANVGEGGAGGGIASPVPAPFALPAVITNTILAGSPASVGGNCNGFIINGGHNLDDGTTCGWGTARGSLSNTNPRLAPLASNGGRTQTMALLANSPAIGRADPAWCPPTDQRGRGRWKVCDSGAFEWWPWLVYLPVTRR